MSGIQKVPVGPLGIIAMNGTEELGRQVNDWIYKRRYEFLESDEKNIAFPGFLRESFIISADVIRFANGEGKGVINSTVRGHDIFILIDIGNYNCKFKMFGMECPMSPDDHFQDLKRIIAAIGGKARRITVIMPMLYEGRQDRRQSRESLDCAVALQELANLGIDNIITFDAHEPRVQNAIPLKGFENLSPAYQIVKALINTEKDLELNKEKMIVVSPDEGAVERNIYYATSLDLSLSMFYKRRDCTRVVNGKNPIINHEYLGDEVVGKDVLIVDDIISSGESMLDVAEELKSRKARRIFIASTFALFTNGIESFDKAYKEGIFDRLYSTNLTYRKPELLNAEWYVDVDLSKFLSFIIDMLNHDQSLSYLIDPRNKINLFLKERGLR
ncbi:MAG TPA: ribose-phosphate pyrophosphokinase [Clostridiaceae bacterium]|jgi:ribose-phosphate pyrophosphokinase|nr:ribose-phosphate pyrophosphokinase [Clostridiaceae bacterium]